MAKKIWNFTECRISVRPTDSKRGKRASQKSSEENSSTGRRASTKKGVRFKSLLSFIIQTSLFIACRKSRFSIRTFWVGRWGLGLRKRSWAVSCGTTRVQLNGENVINIERTLLAIANSPNMAISPTCPTMVRIPGEPNIQNGTDGQLRED